MKIFGERLKELKEEKHISTKQLAEILGVNRSTIVRWESNQILPSIDHLYKIAVYFGVSADYMIGLED